MDFKEIVKQGFEWFKDNTAVAMLLLVAVAVVAGFAPALIWIVIPIAILLFLLFKWRNKM